MAGRPGRSQITDHLNDYIQKLKVHATETDSAGALLIHTAKTPAFAFKDAASRLDVIQGRRNNAWNDDHFADQIRTIQATKARCEAVQEAISAGKARRLAKSRREDGCSQSRREERLGADIALGWMVSIGSEDNF